MLVCVGACTKLSRRVEEYVQAGIAPATKRAYRADLHFEAWRRTIPTADETGRGARITLLCCPRSADASLQSPLRMTKTRRTSIHSLI